MTKQDTEVSQICKKLVLSKDRELWSDRPALLLTFCAEWDDAASENSPNNRLDEWSFIEQNGATNMLAARPYFV